MTGYTEPVARTRCGAVRARTCSFTGAVSESTQVAPDQIMDFAGGEDRVDVSGITASLGKESLKFVSAFSGASGEAIVTYNPVLQMSTLENSGKADEPNFVLIVHGQLQRSDIEGDRTQAFAHS